MPPVPSPSLPPDSEPASPPSQPNGGLWGDSDVGEALAAPKAAFSKVAAEEKNGDPLATIGHIGRYALKQPLGEGGLGTVYVAHSTEARGHWSAGEPAMDQATSTSQQSWWISTPIVDW